MGKLRVALLSGGISSEREVSIRSGNQVYEALDKAKYEVTRYDPATDLERLVAEASCIDVAFVILHGPYGEDGTVQGFLDLLHIPYQGSGVLGSALGMDKWTSKRLYKEAGLPVPPFKVLMKGQSFDAEALAVKPGFPLVVKPRYGGSSIGTSVVRTPEQLQKALDCAFEYGPDVILEAYVKGTEITGGVIGNDDLELLPIVEIIPESNYTFFDYEAKYKQGATCEICPARISPVLSDRAQAYAAAAHQALCCSGYSRTDMIIHDETIYVLETNTIPGMTPVSLFPSAAKTAGISFSQLLDRLIGLALENRSYTSEGHKWRFSR
ncbi:MAG: D-alanine--D-alanine ligase [Desulfobacterales bacterium C00003060]|nr:MAG: D-alanine--D-alanine ligase [Desulfobacterales bacterium S3730MH5]OEU79407.1 MAG: D-alanine--D-alanine ligase [Desulfobacterales bacterium C00003060]OEU84677.1 MAG: D-alanine--D-alanine ligase [Desulfobacterales bacterium S5133MH4]